MKPPADLKSTSFLLQISPDTMDITNLLGVKPGTRMLWIVLAVLIVLVLIISRKTSAADIGLRPDSGYARPIIAIEIRADLASATFEKWDDERQAPQRLDVGLSLHSDLSLGNFGGMFDRWQVSR